MVRKRENGANLSCGFAGSEASEMKNRRSRLEHKVPAHANVNMVVLESVRQFLEKRVENVNSNTQTLGRRSPTSVFGTNSVIALVADLQREMNPRVRAKQNLAPFWIKSVSRTLRADYDAV